jgi:hypothetical protein
MICYYYIYVERFHFSSIMESLCQLLLLRGAGTMNPVGTDFSPTIVQQGEAYPSVTLYRIDEWCVESHTYSHISHKEVYLMAFAQRRIQFLILGTAALLLFAGLAFSLFASRPYQASASGGASTKGLTWFRTSPAWPDLPMPIWSTPGGSPIVPLALGGFPITAQAWLLSTTEAGEHSRSWSPSHPQQGVPKGPRQPQRAMSSTA